MAIFTLPGSHRAITVAAMNAGKHVFTEKPISSTVDDAEAMLPTAAKTSRKLFVGFLLRFTDVYQEMARQTRSGLLGSPLLFVLGGYERYQPENEFAWKRALGLIWDTSCSFDCGSHYVDIMRWCSGAEAVRVHGLGARINSDVPNGIFDYESFHIEFDDGSRGIYATGWGHSFPEPTGFKGVIGPKGYLALKFSEIEEGKESGAKLVFRPNGGEEETVARSSWKGFDAEWEHFDRMIEEDLDPAPALNDALASLRIVAAAHQSALSGSAVEL